MRKLLNCAMAAAALSIFLWTIPLWAEETSLEDFLSAVRHSNPVLQSSAKRLEAFSHTVKSSVAGQRPSLGIRGNTSWLSDVQQGGLRLGERGSYGISAAITHRFDVSGIYSAQEKQLLLQYNGMASDHMALVNNTLAAAESLYWQSFIARENISLQRGILNQRKEDLRITEEKFKQQLIPRLDVIRAQAKVEEAESLVVEAESSYKNTLAQMATLAGGLDLEPVEESLLVPFLSVKAGIGEAIERRNDVRSAEIALERGSALKSLAAKGMSPVLEGSVGYTILTDNDSSSPMEKEFLLSLNVNVPLYDGGRTKEDVLDSQKTIEALERALQSRKDQVTEDVVKALNQWGKAVAVESSKRKQVARSDEELNITQIMYKEGMGAQIDLLNAQVDNQRVKTEHLAAIKEMYLALVSLKQAMSEYEPAVSD
ncbi:MAG: TolC family protein [Synergistaceae bacterium]|nr:TolC family protein [Synergistaceae bacterium]